MQSGATTQPDRTREKKISKNTEIRDRKFTFRDSILYLSTFLNDAVIIEAFFFLNQVLSGAILAGVRERVPLWRKLDAGDQNPLNHREDDPDDGAGRNQDLSARI